MPTLPNTFRTGEPQVGQVSSGSSEKDWTTSKFRSQVAQLYSYVGTVIDSPRLPANGASDR